MACPAVTTGNQFLVQTLAHLDCQVQSIGSFGFQSLAQTGSPAFAVVTGLLTLFIAILGFRLLFGANDGPRDYVGAALKVGIVLTLAASWPAWRTISLNKILKFNDKITNRKSKPPFKPPLWGCCGGQLCAAMNSSNLPSAPILIA